MLIVNLCVSAVAKQHTVHSQNNMQCISGPLLAGSLLVDTGSLCAPSHCRVVGRGFLPRKCVFGTRPVSAHPLSAISVSC